MGTWGHGNLENDYALDELADRTETLVTELLERARTKESREWDEYDYTTLFVEFEILFALEAKGLVHSTLPAATEVRTLAADYIAGWDDFADELDQPFKGKRRKQIVKTFQRFAAMCAKRESPPPKRRKKKKR
jgi:hypothetical protein